MSMMTEPHKTMKLGGASGAPIKYVNTDEVRAKGDPMLAKGVGQQTVWVTPKALQVINSSPHEIAWPKTTEEFGK
jgi:hypothetical protein